MGANRHSTLAFLFAATVVIGASCQSDSLPAAGAPGAHIWFESSVKLDVKRYTFVAGFLGGASQSSCSAWSFSRESLTDAQLTAIEAVTLQPFPAGMACTPDGYSYDEATITDRDGTTATYQDTACDYLRIPVSIAMLPTGFFGADFPLGNSQYCPWDTGLPTF